MITHIDDLREIFPEEDFIMFQFNLLFSSLSYFRETTSGRSCVKYVFLRYDEQILRVKKLEKLSNSCWVQNFESNFSYSNSCLFQYYCICFCQLPSFSRSMRYIDIAYLMTSRSHVHSKHWVQSDQANKSFPLLIRFHYNGEC